jgi:putative DNA primase/helicase
VPFRHPPASRDDHLKEKLEIEYPAILRWMIDGLLDAQTHGPIRPAAIVEATAAYLDDENRIAAWLAVRCERGPAHKQLLKDLFADWKAWCETSGEEPQSNRRLKARLERLPGITVPRPDRQGVWMVGIRLTPPAV